jgi:hypothetical protein
MILRVRVTVGLGSLTVIMNKYLNSESRMAANHHLRAGNSRTPTESDSESESDHQSSHRVIIVMMSGPDGCSSGAEAAAKFMTA